MRMYRKLLSVGLVVAMLMTIIPMFALGEGKTELVFWSPLTSNADKAVHEQLIKKFQEELNQGFSGKNSFYSFHFITLYSFYLYNYCNKLYNPLSFNNKSK